MKKICLHLITLIYAFLLVSCACDPSTNSCFQGKPCADLLKETWLNQVNLNPNQWLNGADKWFLTGEPNRIEQCNSRAPFSGAITTSSVHVPNFVNVSTNGNYQVQIVGSDTRNSVTIVGPNDAARLVAVEVYDHTLFIHQAKNSGTNSCAPALNRVIVRIAVHNLRSLTNRGPGAIYGRNVMSNGLSIYSSGSANIMLAGPVNLTCVTQTGTGTVTVIGACTPSLCIKVKGNGGVNVSGRVGVQFISHHGNGNVNIIGTDTDSLKIDASGSGRTALAGYANLKEVIAKGCSRVYLYWVNSASTYVSASEHARVGLAGNAKNLNVDTTGAARFEGSCLHASNVYVITRDTSHANIAAANKLFANAEDYSSIYFFGAPRNISRFVARKGVVLPVWNEGTPCPPPPSMPWNQPIRHNYKNDRPIYK